MKIPEQDPAEVLRARLEKIAADYAEQQRVTDEENEAAIAELGVGTQTVLDGLARTTKEIKSLPEMPKKYPGAIFDDEF